MTATALGKGWAIAPPMTRPHYFDEGRSLCCRWAYFGTDLLERWDYANEAQWKHWGSAPPCRACQIKYTGRLKVVQKHRAAVPTAVSRLLGGRPARWAVGVIGDYDGRERTLDVFNADASEQLNLLRLLRPVRAEFERVAGGPILVIFHTRAETKRLYPEMERKRAR
jgi:hypothetical protein